MARDPRSATVLIRELRTVVPQLVVERDDLDGLKVYRTFRLTAKGVKGLADVVSAVADARIVQHSSITDGVEVTFTHYTTADQGTEFGVMQAVSLLSTPRKRKARKTAAKRP